MCRALYTGQRVGDAVRMRRSDIRKGAMHVIQGKTGEELYIELHPAFERALKAGPSNGVYLIGDRAGHPIARGGLSALMRVAIKAAGLPGECVAHGLRKAALRRLAEHGSTTKQIQAVSPIARCRKSSGNPAGRSATAGEGRDWAIAGQRLNNEWLTKPKVSQCIYK